MIRSRVPKSGRAWSDRSRRHPPERCGVRVVEDAAVRVLDGDAAHPEELGTGFDDAPADAMSEVGDLVADVQVTGEDDTVEGAGFAEGHHAAVAFRPLICLIRTAARQALHASSPRLRCMP